MHSALVALILTTAALSAGADGTAPLPITPIGAVKMSAFSGIPDMFGLAASLDVLQPLTIEVGASSLIIEISAYGRIGYVLPVLSTRDASGSGWTLRLPFLLGARYMASYFDTLTEQWAATVDVGLDATYWLAPHIGLDIELVGGYVYWLPGSNGTPIPFDARLTIGMAF